MNGDTLPKAKTFEGLSNLESQNENNIEQIDTVKVPIDKNVSLLINEPESQIDEHIPTVQFPPLDPLESMKYSQSSKFTINTNHLQNTYFVSSI